MTPVLLVCVFILFILSGFPFNTLADDLSVVVITSSDSDFQQQTAARILNNLEKDTPDSIIISPDDISSLPRNSTTLYIPIGEYAINTLQEYDNDAFALRINSNVIPGSKYTSTQSDLITAQPDCRHILLIKSINPKWSTVGVLSSIDSLDIAAALTKCAIRQNMDLQVYAIIDKSDLLTTLEMAVVDNKVLLAIIDPFIYNRHTVKNILLTAYRHRKPVIGYSESFVQAGAVAAIYTSPESIGDKAAEIISRFFDKNWQFDKNVYTTDDFSVSTNTQVATSLDIALPATESIRKSIKRMEKRR